MDGKMRIGLFIDTSNFGGAESVLFSLASHLKSAGHHPIVYQFGNAFLEAACRDNEIDCKRASHRDDYKRIFRTLAFAKPFARMLREDRLDVLHSHLSGSIFGGGVACRIAGIPHIGTLHDVYVIQERPVRARLIQCVRWLGTKLVCVSEQMAEYYSAAAHIRLSDIEVIRNGVDLDRFGNVSPRRFTENAATVLIMVGRLDQIKRHDLLLQVLADFGNDPPWQVQIVGDGPERAALESVCARSGLTERVSFLGQRRDIPGLLAAADVFLLISDSEGMSLSLIEAVASGLPVIATDVGNNSELVRDGWNGVVIEPGSKPELKRALEKVVWDKDTRLRFASNSKQMSDTSLDFNRTAASYFNLYRSAAKT